jgi:hypothetical protein
VPTSWTEGRSKFNSPQRVVASMLWRSRERAKLKCRRLKRQLDDSKGTIARQEKEIQRLKEENQHLKQQTRRLEDQDRQQAQSGCRLPADPRLPGHKFGRRMIRLAVNLARVVGLRPAERVLRIVWEWLGVGQKLPKWTTIRTWLMRVGVAVLREPIAPADDWVWMADHSNQIGPEKALVVLGVQASKLPPPGKTLRHEDVRLLTVRPGTAWKREDMAAVYRQLAQQYGAPRAVLCDGAVELREGAECLKKECPETAIGCQGSGEEGAECLKTERPETIVLQDFKHKAAIFLKTAVGDHPRFAEFNTRLGKTRSAIQQTELAHLTPPGQKPKARFMNLATTLDWAAAVLWLLDHPEAKTRAGLSPQRLEEKLGWLRSFTAELAEWRECQQAVKAGVTFINEQGLFRGAGAQLGKAMGTDLTHAASQQLARRLVEFVTAAEAHLKDGERLPMSTEILESTFALYKQLERQHSKGGFTSLLASFGALLKPATDESIQRAFSTVSVKDVQQWTRENLGATLTSKRLATYKEFRSATKVAVTT